MTFLPIVDRELRVAARRRGTFRTRVVIALLAIVIGVCIFMANWGQPEKIIGPLIFVGLSLPAFFYCLLAGRRLTVDCLCEEKREGTLGLLFLTDLKGHDIILGKLAATSLNAFAGLLALFPVLAVPLLMGGISSAQFWRVVLVLVTTFMFSLAVGIYASAAHRSLRRAAGSNLALILLFTLLLPLAGFVQIYNSRPFAGFQQQPLELFYSSPGFAVFMAFDSPYLIRPRAFWWSIGVIQCLTWLLVFCATRIVPHSWQERLTAPPRIAPARVLQRPKSFIESAKHAAHRKRLLDINAFYWLVSRDRHKPLKVWIFLACVLAWWLWGLLSSGEYWMDGSVKITSSLILNTVLKIWIALEVGHRLAADKKSGALELLLSSPLSVRDILRGQWLAVRRQFLGPFLAVVIFELLLLLAPDHTPPYDHFRPHLFVVAGLIILPIDAAVLGLVSLHQALTARSPAHADSRTFFRILVVPWLLLIFIGTVASVGASLMYRPAPGVNFYIALWFVLGLTTDVILGRLAWRQLQNNFRHLATTRSAAAHPHPAPSARI